MPSAKISALTALDSTANLAQLYIPLFKADGSPDNPRILASDLLLAADGVNITPAWSGTGTATTPLLVNVTADPGPANAASKLLDLQVGGSSKVNANKAGDFLARTFQGGESSARSWTLATRDALTGFPVPYFRPVTANTHLAFDIMPNGAVSDVGNGFAWIDVCDTDCATGNPAIAAARLGIRSTHVEIGSRAFNGAASKPVAMSIDDVAKMTFNPSTPTVSHVPFTVSPAFSGTGVQTSPLLVNVSADPGPASAATMLLDLQILGVSKASFNKAGQLICPSAFVNDIYAATSLQVQSNSGSLVFGASLDVGMKRAAASILGITNGSTGGGAIEFTEMTAPATPAANQARVFARDNGSGKTQVCIILPDGVVTVLATQT